MKVYLLDTRGEGLDQALTWLIINKSVKEVSVLKTSTKFLEKVENEKPDLVLISILRQDTSGLNIGRIIATMYPEIWVVFISEEEDLILEGFDRGDYGYLTYPIEKKNLDKMVYIIEDNLRMKRIKEFIENRSR